MKFLVRWARGTIRMEVPETESAKKVFKDFAKKLNVSTNSIFLYSDPKCTHQLPASGTIHDWDFGDDLIIYMKVVENVNTPIAQGVLSRSNYKDYLGEGEDEMTPAMKSFQGEFGPRAVSLAFFEHRRLMKPHIDIQDESSCYAFRIGEEALTRFQLIAFHTQFARHRLCFLFGRVNEVTGKVTAHVACEPQQTNFETKVIVDQAFDLGTAIQIANLFGMTCCGMAISHSPNEKYPMSAYMVRLAAHYQNLFGEYFTTLVVMPKSASDVVIEAYQVSDIAMRLEKEDYFVDLESETELGFREELFVGNRKQSKVDVNVFLCAVRVRQTHSKFPFHKFPAPSQLPDQDDLRIHLSNTEFCPSWYRLFDFNLLMYLATSKLFNMEEISEIISLIIQKEDIPDAYIDRIEERARKTVTK